MSNLTDEVDEHQRLVKILIDQFEIDGLEIVNAAYQGYKEPYKVGRHPPDIIARNRVTEVVSLGEVKLCSALDSQKTREQFEDFSNRQMATTSGEFVPFHILTPVMCAHRVWRLLCQLGLDKRPNVMLWQPWPERLEPAFSNVSIRNVEVRSVSPEGIVEAVAHLEGNVDANFIRWFRNPTAHSSVPSFDTGACRVTIDSISFSVVQNSLKSAVSLIKEWVPIANKHARERYEELQGKKTQDEELNARLEKRRRELQQAISDLH